MLNNLGVWGILVDSYVLFPYYAVTLMQIFLVGLLLPLGERLMRFVRFLVVIGLLAGFCGGGKLKSWPEGACPVEVGGRVAEYCVRHQMGICDYQNFCAAYGVLQYAGAVGDEGLVDCVIAGYGPYLFDWRSPWRDNGKHPAHQWFGFLPFELYKIMGEAEYLKMGRKRADEQFSKARSDGLPGYTRFWADDVYGAPTMQGLASKYLGDLKYADRGVLHVLAHAEKLQQGNGLFHHTAKSEHFWGRANGWAAAGMAELLKGIGEEHPKRGAVMAVYKKMMAGLLAFQDDKGMWHQLLDRGDAWAETSCTGMFVFALATGVQEGWLVDERYREAAERGWIALAGYVDSEGRLKEVCVGTGENSVEGYLGRPRTLADAHGQAPLLWAVTAMMRLD